VLDIGCGDGRLTTAAIHPGLARVDLVEPSAELLTAAQARLAEHDVSVVAHGCTAQDLVDALSSGRDPAWPDRWDSAQSTFALHTLPPEDRQRVLHLLAWRVGRLIVVEFDVPAFADRSAQHARYAAERYAAGVAEYEDDAVVVDGFLMPVLVGQFDPARPRHTWEQPIAEWIAALQRAGFAGVRAQPVSDYWWAPAHLVEATSNGGPDLTRWR
jgi:SAM-dependent methyltransferase